MIVPLCQRQHTVDVLRNGTSITRRLILRSSIVGLSLSSSPHRIFALSLFSRKHHRQSSTDAKPIIPLNHAGASPFSDKVFERVRDHMLLEQTLGGYAAASAVSAELEEVYRSVADLLHASSSQEIALVESATVAWTRIFYSVVNAKGYDKKKIILVSQAEYASNLVAACRVAQEHENWTVHEIPSVLDDDGKSTGKIDLEQLRLILDGGFDHINPEEIALVCVTQIPTNSGIHNPVCEVGRMISDHNGKFQSRDRIFYLVDACQAVGQVDVNVQNMNCDALVGTGRKYVRGPRGTGYLYVRSTVWTECRETFWPSHVDHVGCPVKQVPSVDDRGTPVEMRVKFSPLPSARRFEFYESNIASKLGLGVAIRELLGEGMEAISEKIQRRAVQLHEQLSEVETIKLSYFPECGIVTFWVPGVPSKLLQERLYATKNENRFEVSVVPATSTPLDSCRQNVPDLLRASVASTTSFKEIILFCETLRDILNEQC